MIKPILTMLGLSLLAVAAIAGIRVKLLYRTVPKYADYWKHRAAQPVPQNAIIYVAIGDSAAQGIGAASADRGYVGQIAKMLETQTGRPVHVINLSITGARVRDALETQIPHIKSLKPDLITVAIGANNMRDFDHQNFKTDFEQLISQLPKQTVVSDLPYFGGRRANSNTPAKVASLFIREQIANRNLTLAPLEAATTSNHSWLNYAADLFHPSELGYRDWTSAFTDGIAEARRNGKISI